MFAQNILRKGNCFSNYLLWLTLLLQQSSDCLLAECPLRCLLQDVDHGFYWPYAKYTFSDKLNLKIDSSLDQRICTKCMNYRRELNFLID